MSNKVESITERDSVQKKHLDEMWQVLYERMNQEDQTDADLSEINSLIKQVALLAFHEMAQTSRAASALSVKEIEEFLIKRLSKKHKPTAAQITLLTIQILAIPLALGTGTASFVTGAGQAATGALTALSGAFQQTGTVSSNASQIFSTEQQGKLAIIREELDRQKTLKSDRTNNTQQEQQKRDRVEQDLRQAQQQEFDTKQRVLSS